MKDLWCYNFLIFCPVLTNDTSNKIVLETLLAISATVGGATERALSIFVAICHFLGEKCGAF
jgi:hypothetical protein